VVLENRITQIVVLVELFTQAATFADESYKVFLVQIGVLEWTTTILANLHTIVQKLEKLKLF